MKTSTTTRGLLRKNFFLDFTKKIYVKVSDLKPSDHRSVSWLGFCSISLQGLHSIQLIGGLGPGGSGFDSGYP